MNGMEIRGLITYKSRSSAKMDKLVLLEPSLIPVITGLAWRAIARCSMTKVKRRGNRGQPCRMPFKIGKGDERAPFT